MTSGEPARIGNFRLEPDGLGDGVRITLDTSAIVARMVALEERTTRAAVVAKLRSLGYSVNEPTHAQHPYSGEFTLCGEDFGTAVNVAWDDDDVVTCPECLEALKQ